MKTSELEEITGLSGDDFIVVVNDPTGAAETMVVKARNLFANTAANASFGNVYIAYANTPVSSSDTVTERKIWFDQNYIYVATANNTIKRVALSTF